ncbi:phospholipase D-like domain-containing protein [Clostridium paridis]|uniref:NgoFVII family restriction endonuclease n=1 Tax=Clostridium paridis TaxID=2803863 RepID=A0A937FBN3_9CLOT|nr:phospholipase D-like domain-containing protein [Clostridium paridis]MBL4930939.1 NgoFVII family restriction endonuclease [Clostridium paridis]
MGVELISSGFFADKFYEVVDSLESSIKVISPFIGLKTATKLAEVLKQNPNIKCKIITRFYREDFIQGVSSLQGLNALLDSGAELVALIGLHTKLYVFDESSAILGSANFTNGGFFTNHELSVFIDQDESIGDECNKHFEELWDRIKQTDEGNITKEWIEQEIDGVEKVSINLIKGVSKANRAKRGAKLGAEPWTPFEEKPKNEAPVKTTDILEEVLTNRMIEDLSNAWIKFIAKSNDRLNSDNKFINERNSNALKRVYFNIKPTGIKDNDSIYITALSYDHKDRPSPMIVGRALTYGYDKKNIVTDDEILEDYTRKNYPYYIEFKECKIIDTPIKNTVPLHILYDVVGTKTYPSSAVNPKADRVYLNKVHSQKSHLRITQMAKEFLDKTLDEYFKKYGKIEL